MDRLVKVKINDTDIWMETENVMAEDKPQTVSRESMARAALSIAENLQGTINSYCSSLVRAFDSMGGEEKPKRVKAEFGLKLSGDCKVYIVNAGGEASLKITAEWEMR